MSGQPLGACVTSNDNVMMNESPERLSQYWIIHNASNTAGKTSGMSTVGKVGR